MQLWLHKCMLNAAPNAECYLSGEEVVMLDYHTIYIGFALLQSFMSFYTLQRKNPKITKTGFLF